MIFGINLQITISNLFENAVKIGIKGLQKVFVFTNCLSSFARLSFMYVKKKAGKIIECICLSVPRPKYLSVKLLF